jgi:glyoxylase I family protein
MAIQGFSHVGVCCSDLERSSRFYTEVLGFSEVFTMQMGNEVAATMEQPPDIAFESRMLSRGDVRLELLHWLTPEAGGSRERRPMTQFGLTHLCFRVDDVEELAAEVERNGGAVHRQTHSNVPGTEVHLMYVTDPDGVRVEFMAGVPTL